MLAGKFSGRKSSSEKNWPGVGDRASLIFEDRHDFWLSFITDGSNTDWGWRLTVSPLLPPGVQDKSLSDLTVRPIPMSTATDKVDSGARLNLQTYLATPSSGIALVEFGEGLTRPSLGVALALFDLLLDAAVTPEFLFETDTGCAILTNLSQCAGAIGDSQPWLARTFFDIVTRITLLYRHYRKMQGVEDSFNLASSSTEVRETMMLMSKHVLMLAYIAATSRRLTSSSTSGKSSNVNPSPLFQSICQAAVSSAVSICFDNPRLGPGPSAPALMRSDSIVDTNMELSTIEPKFDTLVRTTSVSSEPRDDAVKLAASLQSDTDTLDDADFVALAMDDKSSENDDESVDDYLDRLAPGQNGPIFPSMPYPFPSHPVEKNGSQNEVLISSLVQDEVKVTPVTATINLSTDSTQGQRSVPVSDKGYTYTHYVKVAKWGNPRGSQPFAIGVTLLTDPGSSELWEDEYSSGKVTFQNSLTWVSYPSRGPVLGGGDGAGSMSRFIWSQSDSDKLAIETIKQLESIDDAEADLEDSDDSLDVVQVAEESEEEEDDEDDKDSFLVGLGQKSSNEVFSVQSSVAFKEGDIVSITLNVSPSDWVGQKAPPAQVVFARNGTDIALFEVHCDNASALRFRPSWQGSEIANLNELIWANSKVTNTGKGVEIAPSSAFVSPVKSVGSPSYSPSSAFLGTTEKLNKFSHLLDRISDVNSRLRSSLTSSLQQALLPTGIAEDGPLLYSAGSSDRPIPGQPSIRIKPITSYFEPSVPSVNLGLSRQINTTIGTPPPAPSSISNLSPAAFAAITPPSNRRMESSNIPLSLTRRHIRPQRSAGKKPVGRGSSAIKSDPSDQLPAAMAPLSVAVSLGNIHAEIRGEQGLDTPASRRNSIAPQSPMLLFHQDKTSRGSHIALLINIPQGGEVEYLIPSEVPTVARRPSTVAINTTRYAVTSSMIAGVSSSTSAAALPPSVKTITRVPTSIVERPLSLTEFSGRVLSRWEASISDTELQFSRKETVARRPGSVSCYPASLLSVPIDDLITTFALTMVLQHAPRGPNSMSIGIANAGFRSSGSDGFGQSVNSWGLIESRASGDGKLCSNRQHIDSFRKMREGDVFSIVYDRSLGKAWLLVAHASTNTVVEAGGDYSQVLRQLDTELCHEFTIHAPGERAELVLGATYCNVCIKFVPFIILIFLF